MTVTGHSRRVIKSLLFSPDRSGSLSSTFRFSFPSTHFFLSFVFSLDIIRHGRSGSGSGLDHRPALGGEG